VVTTNPLARAVPWRIWYPLVKANTSSCRLLPVALALIVGCGATALAAPTPTGAGASSAVTDTSRWPRFRGPNGSGLSDAEIPAQWSEKDYNWKIGLPGGGHSSPVVWDDRIFLICGDEQTGEHMVVCVNAADGSIRWVRKYPSSTYPHHQYNSYASSTPAVDEKHVYVCWSTPEELSVLALDHDGKDVWTRGLGSFVSQHGGGQSPIVYQNLLVLGDDNEGPQSFLFGLDRDSGNVVWQTSRGHSDKFSASTPCVLRPRHGEEQLVFASKAHGFTALEPRDGHVIWELNKVFDARTVSSPFIADGLIFGSCGDGPSGHALVAARPGEDGASATVAYDLHKSVPYVPTPIVKNDLLFYFTDNGVLTCAHASSGKTVWKQRLDGNFFGSPVCARDKIFILSKEGDVYAIAAAEKFELLAKNPLKLEESDVQQPPLSSTPAIAGGRMYVHTYRHLVSVGGK